MLSLAVDNSAIHRTNDTMAKRMDGYAERIKGARHIIEQIGESIYHIEGVNPITFRALLDELKSSQLDHKEAAINYRIIK